MSTSKDPRLINRRNFLKAAGVVTAGGLAGLGSLQMLQKVSAHPIAARLLGNKAIKEQHVGFTDGWVSMPLEAAPRPPFWPDPGAPDKRNAYVFGIRNLMTPSDPADRYNPGKLWKPMSESMMFDQKGHAQLSAPLLFADQGSDFRLHLHNLGEQQRPVGNPDNHTIHFHGFTNQIVYFDGVPDNSVAAAIGRELIYHYFPEDPGSYMYHCHIDDVEHVHMGLYGIIWIRSTQMSGPQGQRAAFNDPLHPVTNANLLPLEQQSWYDREFAMIITEFDVHAHWNDAHNQDTDWSEYNGAFRLMNGRAYPDTIQRHLDPMFPGNYGALERLRSNPNSALIQGNAGERIMVRISNLGFEEHSLLLPGIPLTVVGRDAKPLFANRIDYGVDWSEPSIAGSVQSGSRGNIQWTSNRVDLGPGESRDMIITLPSTNQTAGGHDVYPFYDRNYGTRLASSSDGVGGMRTEVHVYPEGTLQAQTRPAGLYIPDGSGGWTETWAPGTEPV